MMNKTLFSLLIVLTFITPTYFSHANEPIAHPQKLLQAGFKKVNTSKIRSLKRIKLKKNTLPWPVTFQSDSRKIGNSMAQFQGFSQPGYWHSGCDLLTQTSYPVKATVSGKVEAGHYSYVHHADGSKTKYWKPWPAQGSEVYFEVAIVTEENFRFEFHHIDRSKLPEKIIKILEGKIPNHIQAGEVVGYAVNAFGSYNHIHYNILGPDGVDYNPEYISALLPDSIAPKIEAVYAVQNNDVGLALNDRQVINFIPKEIVAAVWDKKEEKSPFQNPPPKVRIEWQDGRFFEWDFTEKLRTAQMTYPNLFHFFKDQLKISSFRSIRTEYGYGTGVSLVRFPIPENAKGSFRLRFFDQAGNESVFQASLP